MKKLVFLSTILICATAWCAFAAEEPDSAPSTVPATSQARTAATASAPSTQASQPVELGVYAEMPAQCGLSAQQTAKLEELVRSHNEQIDSFWTTHRTTLNDLQIQLSKAIKDNDPAKIKELQEKLQAVLKHKYGEMRVAQDREILALLTQPQRVKWENFQLQDILRENYWKVEFTPEQTKKMLELYQSAAEKMAKLDPIDQTKARDEIILDLAKQIDENVLTPEQRNKRQ